MRTNRNSCWPEGGVGRFMCCSPLAVGRFSLGFSEEPVIFFTFSETFYLFSLGWLLPLNYMFLRDIIKFYFEKNSWSFSSSGEKKWNRTFSLLPRNISILILIDVGRRQLCPVFFRRPRGRYTSLLWLISTQMSFYYTKKCILIIILNEFVP